MGSPFVFNGQRPKALTSQGPLLQTGVTLDNDGVKNYLKNPGAELGTTTGWTAFNTTFTNNVPGAISAGSTKLSVANVSTNVIDGSYSFQMNITTATSSAGHGVISDIFTISNRDLAKVLQGVIDYTFASGASNVDVSGTSTQTFEIWVYNVGNSAWTQPAGYLGINVLSGFGRNPFTFQTDSSNASNKNQYRIAILIKNAPAGAVAMNYEMSCGPQNVQIGAYVGDWTAYTPTVTGLGTQPFTNQYFYYKREGDMLLVQGSFTAGTTSAVLASISLPSGLSIDSNKIGLTNTTSASGVEVGNYTTATIAQFGPIVTALGTATNLVYLGNNSGGTPGTRLIPQIQPTSSSQIHTINFKVPIAGWGTSQILSSDTSEGRSVAVFSTGDPGASMGATFAIVKYPTPQNDTHGAYSNSTGLFTAPVPGFYAISATFPVSATWGAAGQRAIATIFKSGTEVARTAAVASAAGTFSMYPMVSVSAIYLKAGDTLGVYSYVDGGTPSMPSNQQAFLSIARVSGSSLVSASETVAARYYSTAGQSIANTGANVVNFDVKDYDTHGSVTTGSGWVYAAPVSGLYQVSADVWGQAAVWTAGQVAYLSIYKNPTISAGAVTGGTLVSDGILFSAFNATMQFGLTIEDSIRLNAGDTITITLTQNRTGGAVNLSVNSNRVNAVIRRVGN